MSYRSLQACVTDLERAGHLIRLEQEIDARLEAAEIHRRVFRSGGPAVLFASVRGCRFPMVSNLFGTAERARFLFRDTWESVRRLIELKVNSSRFWQTPARYWKTPMTAWSMLPRRVRRAPVLEKTTTVSQLPQLVSWPCDGGAFITLPQVYTENVEQPGVMHSNLGMYRIQLSDGHYDRDREVGLHYQIHRGIGVHQAAAIRQGLPLPVNVFVGGSPAMTLAAVMPLPEGLTELTFAGALAGYRIPMAVPKEGHLPIYADADFCLTGSIVPGKLLPEGPFGDHLGYYSLAHDFPVMRVGQVYCRENAIWPFTVVGRPPQEDTTFGQLIHELTGDIIPTVLPGVHAVHAVDAAGVHPLLLAIGSERYVPFRERRRPAELLTQANAILGQGQLSLAKFLFIVNRDDDPTLDVHDIGRFFQHVLERVDWECDLHFQTCTTIDTLDYSGTALNEGSKVVVAAIGSPRRSLAMEIPGDLRLPERFFEPRICRPGVLAIRGPSYSQQGNGLDDAMDTFCLALRGQTGLENVPLVVIVDDSDFLTRSLNNFLWTVFTRSDPAVDIHGVEASVRHKHWGCRGPLVIDARVKPHHAPALSEDPETVRRVDALAARGGPLAKWL